MVPRGNGDAGLGELHHFSLCPSSLVKQAGLKRKQGSQGSQGKREAMQVPRKARGEGSSSMNPDCIPHQAGVASASQGM